MKRRTAATVYSVIISDMNELETKYGFTPEAAQTGHVSRANRSERKAWENAPVSVRATWEALGSILLRGDTATWDVADPVMDSAYELAAGRVKT